MKNSIKKHVALFMSVITVISAILANSNFRAQAAGATVWYCVHGQDYGWQATVTNGEIAGTTGRSLRMEAIQVDLSGVSGGVQYRAHTADIGWLNWVTNRQTAGTTGRGLQMEAIQIILTGEASNLYDIYYRAHVGDVGWQDWVKNGEVAGTTGRSLRMEAIQIKLVAKNSKYSSVLNNGRVQSFINDSRWCVGTTFTNNVTGKLPATRNMGWGCNAYARDFVYYVYGKALTNGSKYTNVNELRAGDAVFVTPTHWMIILERNGNTINVIHGNWTNGKVCRNTFTISGNKIGNKTFSYGYHY